MNESVDSYLDRGGTITVVEPGVTGISEDAIIRGELYHFGGKMPWTQFPAIFEPVVDPTDNSCSAFILDDASRPTGKKHRHIDALTKPAEEVEPANIPLRHYSDDGPPEVVHYTETEYRFIKKHNNGNKWDGVLITLENAAAFMEEQEQKAKSP